MRSLLATLLLILAGCGSPPAKPADVTNDYGTIRLWGTSAQTVGTFTVSGLPGAYRASVEAFRAGSVPTQNCPITATLDGAALEDGAVVALAAGKHTVGVVTGCDWLIVLEYQVR